MHVTQVRITRKRFHHFMYILGTKTNSSGFILESSRTKGWPLFTVYGNFGELRNQLRGCGMGPVSEMRRRPFIFLVGNQMW